MQATQRRTDRAKASRPLRPPTLSHPVVVNRGNELSAQWGLSDPQPARRPSAPKEVWWTVQMTVHGKTAFTILS